MKYTHYGGRVGKEMPCHPLSAPSLLLCSWPTSRPLYPSTGYIRGAALRKNSQQLPASHPAGQRASGRARAEVAQLRREVRGSGRAAGGQALCLGRCCPLQTSAIHTEPDSGPLEVNEKTLRDVSGFWAEPSVRKSSSTFFSTQQHREIQEHPETPRLRGSQVGADSIFPWQLLKHIRGWQQVFSFFFLKGRKNN